MENETDPDKDLQIAAGRLKTHVTLLGGPAQAHRRTIQMGRFQGTCKFVAEDGARVPEMVAAGLLTREQGDQIALTREKLVALTTGREDPFDEARSAPREFLWGDALEDDEWREVRHAARRCHALLDLPANPLER